jgi:uncharacterized protein YndB with AHSA1/START domain
MSHDSVHVFEWDVRAPIELVFDTLADPRTYPLWWSSVVVKVAAEGPVGVGLRSEITCAGPPAGDVWFQHAEIVRYERPSYVESRVKTTTTEGVHSWTLSQAPDHVHIRREICGHASNLVGQVMGALFGSTMAHFVDLWDERAKQGLGPYLQSVLSRG